MIATSRRNFMGLTLAALAAGVEPRLALANGAETLPSWSDGAARKRILDFITASVTEGSPGYVRPED
ncbi:MAG: haloacid dehalogenase-like hydrolase, partial [Aestuariivirga sp.]